jgi:septal ring factor EnvC (AmiA/AmiB activator)
MASKVATGSAIILAAAGTTLVLRRLFRSKEDESSTVLVSVDDEASQDGNFIQPQDVIKAFDTLFMHMQQVLAQLSQQIQQIQAAGQMIPEAQLRQLLKQEFERALVARQPKTIEDCDMDEDCFEEATNEFLADPEKYPKVKRAVERFQKLYENVSGESITGSSEKQVSDHLTQEKLLKAAATYFGALTDAMRSIVMEFKNDGAHLSDKSVAQAVHMKFASVANDAGEEALKKMGLSLDEFKAGIEQHSNNPEVGRTLTMLQMQQQQELMEMGLPAM